MRALGVADSGHRAWLNAQTNPHQQQQTKRAALADRSKLLDECGRFHFLGYLRISAC
jgi:hypothetical protein